MSPDQPWLDGPTVVYGMGITGRAVVRALAGRGHDVVAVDDRAETAAAAAGDLGRDVVTAPDADRLARLLAGAGALVPSPGIPEQHPLFGLAERAGVPVVGELDLASAWDDRPCVAITGTDGKTTVTTLVTAVFRASGVAAVDAGNTEVPLVAAIDDPAPQVFVVEASSFRLAPLRRFAPAVGAWLNFAPDHLDVHRDMRAYEQAKANIWGRMATVGGLAVANADDPVVSRHAAGLPRVETFGLAGLSDTAGMAAMPGPRPDWHVAGGSLRTPDGTELVAVAGLHRAFPHDVANALAASATALGAGAGATVAGAAQALAGFRGLPHRVTLVGEAGGVRWYDDSKATAPHATLAAVGGFPSVVLIAGGRNKGLDLSSLAGAAPRLRAVVAIGEAADDVARAFDGLTPVQAAASMDAAVAAAQGLARSGDAILLSPGCASFDWYRSYGERGDDFTRAVHELLEAPA